MAANPFLARLGLTIPAAMLLTLGAGSNVVLDTATGSQIGTATTQKLAFFGSTPIVQPGSTTDIRTALINLGLYATGGASPLNLNGGALTAAAGTFTGVTIGDGTTSANGVLLINAPAGKTKSHTAQTGGSTRWTYGCGAGAESGANAGSAWFLSAFDDSAVQIDTPIFITRASGGAIAFARPLQPGSGSAGAPSYAFSSDTTTGFFRAASGAVGYASAGTEKLRITASSMLLNGNAGVALGSAPITAFAGFNLYGADTTAAYYGVMTFGASPGIFCKRAEGTSASLTQSTTSSVLFELLQSGYEATTPGFTSGRVSYRLFATESYTSTAQGYDHRWFTTATGGTTNNEKMRLEASGSLLVGTTTDGLTAAGSLAVAQDFAHRGTNFGVYGTSPIAKKTGYGTPTGNAYQASFAAGSITLANLAAGVAQLILDLKAYGLIGT